MSESLPIDNKKGPIRFLGIPISRKKFIEWKIYFDRTRMYLGYINFFMIAYVFLNSIEDQQLRQSLDENKFIIYPIVMVAFILISLWFGRLETKLGMRSEELRNYAASNPVMMEILESVNEVKDAVNSSNKAS